MGPDKFQKQVNTEVLSKALGNVIKSLGHEQVDVRRAKGEVLVNWRPLALLDIKSKDDVDLLCDAEWMAELEIDKGKVNELLFAGPSTRVPPLRWSS